MAMRTGLKVSFLAAVNDIAGLGSGGTGEEAEITWHRWGRGCWTCEDWVVPRGW